jgi:two-component system LytT family sensor kinase
MNSVERTLRTKHLLWYNFTIWLVLCGAEILKTFSFAESFGFDFNMLWIIRWPISFYLTFWILSYFVFQVYISSRHLKSIQFIGLHLFTSIVFATLHKILSPVIALLLERLFYDEETLQLVNLRSSIQQTWFDIFLGIIVYWAIVVILMGINYYRKFQDEYHKVNELESQLVRSQLESMKMQIHPHFLFNALNTISMMVRKDKKEDAVNMISNLGDMLRQSLLKETRQFVTLKDEVLLLKKYLSIETVRYKDRLTVEMDMDESLYPHLVPNLILQPIVENAFKHGISKNLGSSVLKISSSKKNNMLHLQVFNSGSELPLGWEFHKNKGIGLLNTSTRLMKLYDDEVKFLIYEMEDGVSVEIILPLSNHE